MNKKVIPFSNATEADVWKANNCYKCRLYETENTEPESAGCKLAFYLDMGYIDDGVPLWVCNKIGITSLRQGKYVSLVKLCTQKPKYKPSPQQRRRYNLHRSAKRAGFTGLNARKRTFFTAQVDNIPEPVKILMKEFNYVIQTEI